MFPENNRKNNRRVKALRVLAPEAPPERVRRALRELTGVSDTDAARILGTHRSTISQHVAGIRRNPEIQAGLAALWGVPVEEVFPQDERRCA